MPSKDKKKRKSFFDKKKDNNRPKDTQNITAGGVQENIDKEKVAEEEYQIKNTLELTRGPKTQTGGKDYAFKGVTNEVKIQKGFKKSRKSDKKNPGMVIAHGIGWDNDDMRREMTAEIYASVDDNTTDFNQFH